MKLELSVSHNIHLFSQKGTHYFCSSNHEIFVVTVVPPGMDKKSTWNNRTTNKKIVSE